MSTLNVRIEGGLLSPDFLESIAEASGQKPNDFGLDPRQALVDMVTTAWSDARSYWNAFQKRLTRGGESTTTITRDMWVLPLLELLDYKLIYRRRAAQVAGKTYPISHRAGEDDSDPPIHIVGCDQELGSRPRGGGAMSPHAMVQDYLNRTDHLWGLVTNGYILRLLRDSSYFTRPTYIEFDLQQMLDGERLDEFILLYRLVHRTRLPQGGEDAPRCWLEQYHQQAIEQGGRIRDGLRGAVEQALLTLGNGFLHHPKNEELRGKFRSGELTARGLYQQLLYLVYRFLFLMVAEERYLLERDDGSGDSRVYEDYLSFSRLRTLSQEPLAAPERFDDLYLGLQALFQTLRDEALAATLGVPVLNGKLFSTTLLDGVHLNNRDLLAAVRGLSYFTSKEERVSRRVNYAALDVEELGSVYESLLDYQPHVQQEPGGRLSFSFFAGTERKTTGSYYTQPALVNELIKSALEPVLAERLKTTGEDREKRLQALLRLRVCDPACGSGHFLLAAARRIGREVARVRTGEDEPAPDAVREGVREAITHCIYGVDKNELAVDLCKVALWIEGHSRGRPLTFLNHRIRHGDSLVGVLKLEALSNGIPDGAYKPVTGDESTLATAMRKRNAEERAWQTDLFTEQVPKPEISRLAELSQQLGSEADPDMAAVRRKEEMYEKIRASEAWQTLNAACNLWTAAFFTPLSKKEGHPIITTTEVRRALIKPKALDGRVVGMASALAEEQAFFHWPIEFPEVFSEGGFDVVLSNPPWERIKLQEQEFFAARDSDIAQAPNKAVRERLIRALSQTNPALWQSFHRAKHGSEAMSRFLRASERYPLTARGDINTYAVFAEHLTCILRPTGRAGIIVPTGISTDDTNKQFFASMVDSQRLTQLVGFENEAFIFPDVHNEFKFCALTVGGTQVACTEPDYVFFCRYFYQVQDKDRHFTLTRKDIARINPNTRTCPVFRTSRDADLAERIYERVPVLTDEAKVQNPWDISFLRMLDLSNDSHLFRSCEQLEGDGFRLNGNRFAKSGELWLPLYEAKMIWQFEHRFASLIGNDSTGSRPSRKYEGWYGVDNTDPRDVPIPRYWVHSAEVESRLQNMTSRRWLLGFRDITNAVVERTAIFSLLPRVGIGNSAPVLLVTEDRENLIPCLLANLSSLVFDWVARQKIAGTHMNFFFVKQLPVLPPSTYSAIHRSFTIPRVLELVYTAWDLRPFADDVWKEADEGLRAALKAQWEANAAATGGGHRGIEAPEWAPGAKDGFPCPPFKWDEIRRAVLRAELDALYARLYGLTEEELRYILDPADVYGPDFPGETFRVLKEKEIRAYGEYRTRRLVLEAWNRLGAMG